MDASLQERWTPDLIERAGQGFAERRLFTPFPTVIVGNTEYVDLRGLTIRHPVRDTLLDHVDLSYAQFELVGSFYDVLAIRCRFVGATLRGNITGTYCNCTFDGGNFDGTTIYGGTVFFGCSFAQANLRRAKGAALQFLECDFSGANLRNSRFSESLFYKCTWDDVSLHHTALGGSRMTRAGFPAEKEHEQIGRLGISAVMLDHVKWLD